MYPRSLSHHLHACSGFLRVAISPREPNRLKVSSPRRSSPAGPLRDLITSSCAQLAVPRGPCRMFWVSRIAVHYTMTPCLSAALRFYSWFPVHECSRLSTSVYGSNLPSRRAHNYHCTDRGVHVPSPVARPPYRVYSQAQPLVRPRSRLRASFSTAQLTDVYTLDPLPPAYTRTRSPSTVDPRTLNAHARDDPISFVPIVVLALVFDLG